MTVWPMTLCSGSSLLPVAIERSHAGTCVFSRVIPFVGGKPALPRFYVHDNTEQLGLVRLALPDLANAADVLPPPAEMLNRLVGRVFVRLPRLVLDLRDLFVLFHSAQSSCFGLGEKDKQSIALRDGGAA